MSLNKVILIGNVGRDPEVRWPMVRLFRNVRNGTMWLFAVIWSPLWKNG